MNTSLEIYLGKIQRVLSKNIFFVAGTEKSGTTWLQMLLDHHPQAVCKGEGQFATKLWPTMRKGFDEYSAFVGGLNQKVFKEVDQFPVFHERSIRAVQVFSATLLLSEYGDDARILAVGEKTPGHLRTLDRLKVLFPEAKFILIYRDGRDIAVSGWYHLKRQFGEDQADPLPAYAKRIAAVWRNDYEKAVAFAERYPGDCAQLRYEDLHENPVQELARLFDFLGLDSSPEIVNQCVEACNFDKLAGGRQRGEENLQSHFRKGIVGDWRNHFDQDTWAMFDAEAGALLEKLGYPRQRDAGADSAPSMVMEPGIPRRGDAPPRLVSTVLPPGAAQESPLSTAEDADRGTVAADPMQLARALTEKRDWQGAAAALRHALAAGQDGFEAWYLLGQALRGIKDHAGAAEAYQKAAAFDPMHQDAQLMAAITLKEADQPEAAVAAYRRLLELHPQFANGWRLYGMLLKGLGRHAEAVTALRESLKLRADIPTHNALIITLEESGQTQQAIAEGGQLLAYKDQQAMAAFSRSPLQPLVLDPAPRAFNYKTPERNIISFSLWGDDPVYVHGAIVNARIAPNLYYGWRTRFYCDQSVPADALEELKRNGAEVVMVTDPLLQPIRPLWRFLVSDDANVDWFMCRDTDSRLNAQELLAVEQWVRSGKAFHIMRDHVYHMELILAGMWGGMARVLPNLREIILNDPRYAKNRFSDQLFLMERVWPLIKEQALIHDSYYRLHGAQDFPSGYRLPRPIHVGGAVKNMGTWRRT
ncbi:MAG: tetratricopeptide repeat protein [Methylococcaceae bacterium]|nr:MAG: tetratricopeptide repeat protein [Methylococcaceae bacterium]